jgi:hypothetical protein
MGRPGFQAPGRSVARKSEFASDLASGSSAALLFAKLAGDPPVFQLKIAWFVAGARPVHR